MKPDLLWSYAGLPVAVLSGIVWLTTLVRRCPAPWVLWASLLTGVGATTLTLQILTEPRYLLAGIAAQIALTCLAISFIRQRALRYAAAVVMIALMFGVTPAPGPDYNHVASTMAARLTGPVLLASEFEGAIIAAAAASHPDTEGAGYWLRATKLLGDLTWGGAVRRLYVRNNSDVDSLLRQNGVNQVFLDVPARGYEPPHTRLLRRTLAEQASLWDVEPLPVRGGTALLYRRRAPVPAQKLSVYVNRLGRRLDAR